MSHESEFSRENPPLTHKGHVAAVHFFQADILATADFRCVFRESAAERPLALGGPPGRLTDVDQSALEVQSVDSAGLGTGTLNEWQ